MNKILKYYLLLKKKLVNTTQTNELQTTESTSTETLKNDYEEKN
jgi:hypothetical protein